MSPTDPPSREGLTGAVRRAVGGALDATVGRVGDTARDVTGATARQIVEDLEPYLIEQAVPRIVDGLTPYLVDSVVPGVLDGLTEHLVDVTVPAIVDGLNDHLVEVTVPAVLTGATPQLVDELLPRLLVELRPFLEQELVPRIVDALMPHLEQAVAPQLVDSLLPKIRSEVVPTVLDDIVDDPRVRDLIREQSLGLVLDAIERGRRALAAADDLVELIARRLIRRGARPPPGPLAPAAPAGRRYAHAGGISRLAAFALDVTVALWLISQGLSALLNVLTSLFGDLPAWVVAMLTASAASLGPTYLGTAWWVWGATLGSALVGFRVCTGDGRKPRFLRAQTRAWLGLPFIVIWSIGMLPSIVDPRRRGWLDRITGTEARYSVHEAQQRRYRRAQAATGDHDASHGREELLGEADPEGD